MDKKLRIAYAIIFILLLLAEVLIALFINDRFIRPYVGDMLVTILICCFLRIFIPLGVPALPIYIFLFAAAVEIGQYFDVVKLMGMAENRFVSILLGRTFSAADLVCYGTGCIIFLGIQHFFWSRHKTR